MTQENGGNGDKTPTRPSNNAVPSGGRDEVSQRELDAETLAALIDGKLDPAEHSALIARIGSSDEDADVLSDALAALGDIRRQETVDINDARSMIESRGRHGSIGRWIVLAASIVVAAAVPMIWAHRRALPGTSPTLYATNLVANGVRIPAAWNDTPWSASRGSSSIAGRGLAIRIGARLTDLEVSARSGDTTAVRYALSLAALLDELPAAAPIASMYRGIATRVVGTGKMDVSSLDSAGRAVAILPEASTIEMGAWLEAARIAAASGNAEFFRTPEAGRMMDAIDGSREANSGVSQTVDAVRRDVAASAPDWSTISVLITKLLAERAGSSQ